MLEKIARTIAPILNVTNAEIIIDLILSFYTVPYAVTTRSLARYSGRSLRSWFRFLSEDYDWVKCRTSLFAKFIYDPKTVYVLGADETMQPKSRKHTYGIDRFYNSIVGITQRGVGFLGMAIIDVQKKESYNIGIQQIVRTDEDKARTAAQKATKQAATKQAATKQAATKQPTQKQAATKTSKKKTNKKNTGKKKTNKKGTAKKKNASPKGKPVINRTTTEVKPKPALGRPLGSKNKPKTEENIVETPSLRYFQLLLEALMRIIPVLMPNINLKHIVGDNAYATLKYLNAAAAKNLFLISKLKHNTILQLPHIYTDDAQYTRGRPKVYGTKITNENPPKEFLTSSVIDQQAGTRTETFQFEAFAPGCFGQILLNIVIVRTEDIATKKVSVIIFFSNDLKLSAQQIWDYYHVRYQIEFDFRDAKQYFGFADFKNFTQNNVTNIVNLSFLLCLISKILLPHYRQTLGIPTLSIRDLKIIFNTRFTLKSFFNLSQKTAGSVFNQELIDEFVPLYLTNAA